MSSMSGRVGPKPGQPGETDADGGGARDAMSRRLAGLGGPDRRAQRVFDAVPLSHKPGLQEMDLV